MELIHTFDVPATPQRAFEVLRDIERIGPCMPGAVVDEVDGDHFTGRVKVKLGPIQVTYHGEADYVDVDPEALTATINARGRESRGSGTANATVSASVQDGVNGGASVRVVTDLAITGKPAQFGRSVMNDVGAKLIGQFADCLAAELADDTPDVAPTDTATDTPADTASDTATDTPADATSDDATDAAEDEAPAGGPEHNGQAGEVTSIASADSRPRPSTPRAEPEAIDLLDVAGAPVAQRLAPIAVGLILLWWVLRRIRR